MGERGVETPASSFRRLVAQYESEQICTDLGGHLSQDVGSLAALCTLPTGAGRFFFEVEGHRRCQIKVAKPAICKTP